MVWNKCYKGQRVLREKVWHEGLVWRRVWYSVRLASDGIVFFLRSVVCRGLCMGWYEYGLSLAKGGKIFERVLRTCRSYRYCLA